jgi:ABC-type transporter Mla subunit MlaD
MASLKDVERVADDLEGLVGQLRSELPNGDFEKLTQLADQISEHADNAAETFSSVNETLMARIGEVAGNRRGSGSSSSSGRSRSRSQSSSSSSNSNS